MGVNSLRLYRGLVFLFFLVGSISCSIAQEEVRIERIDGDRYVLHTVMPKQTLYGISKKYNVSIEELTKANPILEEGGLKINQVIKIPYSRDVRKDLKKKEVSIKGDTIFHTVLKKETLYALSRRYKINMEQIQAWNPMVAQEGLKEGSTLAIPYTQSPLADDEDLVLSREDSLLLHEVKPKETLFSLSKKYGVSIDSIQMVNPSISTNLQIGKTLRIPIKNPKFKPSKYQTKFVKIKPGKDSTRLPVMTVDTAVVALLLPFYLERNDTLDTSLTEDYNKPYHISKASFYALDFYRGFLVAADSLKNQGHHFKIKVFDTGNDKNKIDQILNGGDLDDVQLVIGPLFRSNFEYVAEKLRSKSIGLVSPVRISSKILLDKEHVAKVEASDPAHIIGLSKYVAKYHPVNEIILVDNGRNTDKYSFELSKKYINGNLRDTADSVWAVNMFSFTTDRVNALVGDSGHTVFVIPSEDQAYVTKALITLNSYVQEYDSVSFTVYGLEKWSEFSNLSSSLLMRLNVHLVSQHYIDYNNANVVSYLKRYRNNYGSDPNKLGFVGFDVGYYFLQQAQQYGPGCIHKLPDLEDEMLTTKFDFIKVGTESGYENSAVYIVKFEDYELKRKQ